MKMTITTPMVLVKRLWNKYLTAVEDYHKDSLDPYKEICRVYDLLMKQESLSDLELELKHRLGSFINRTTWRNLFRQGLTKKDS